LTSKGKTEKAFASLRLDYKVDDVVKASETGALGAGTSSPTVRSNTPPVVTIEGPATRTAKVGQPLSLVATLTDDGIPKALTEAQLNDALLARARAASAATAAATGGSTAATGTNSPPPAAARRPPLPLRASIRAAAAGPRHRWQEPGLHVSLRVPRRR
jgi:hypothetical protein